MVCCAASINQFMGYMLKFDLDFSLKQPIEVFFPDIIMFKYNYPLCRKNLVMGS